MFYRIKCGFHILKSSGRDDRGCVHGRIGTTCAKWQQTCEGNSQNVDDNFR